MQGGYTIPAASPGVHGHVYNNTVLGGSVPHTVPICNAVCSSYNPGYSAMGGTATAYSSSSLYTGSLQPAFSSQYQHPVPALGQPPQHHLGAGPGPMQSGPGHVSSHDLSNVPAASQWLDPAGQTQPACEPTVAGGEAHQQAANRQHGQLSVGAPSHAANTTHLQSSSYAASPANDGPEQEFDDGIPRYITGRDRQLGNRSIIASEDFDLFDLSEELQETYWTRTRNIPSMDWLREFPLRMKEHIVNISLLDAEEVQDLTKQYNDAGLQHQAFTLKRKAGAKHMPLDSFLRKIERDQWNMRRYLIYGPPGVGKTVALCYKLPYEWSVIRALNNYLFVIIVPLRESKLAQETDPAELLLSRVSRLERKPHVRQKLYERLCDEAKRLLIVFDGIDEVRKPSSKSAFIRIMHGELLPQATVLVSGRPCKLASEYGAVADQCVEVIGFNDNDVDQFVRHRFAKNPKKADGLMKIYHQQPTVAVLMRIPLLTLVISFLYVKNGKVEDLYSALYRTLFQNWVKRHIQTSHIDLESIPIPASEHTPPAEVCAFEDFSAGFQSFMYRLGRLALQQLLSTDDDQQLVFSANLVDKDDREMAMMFGFLTHAEVKDVTSGLQETLQFPHLTFQEFLGCVYIASTEQEKQYDLIARCVDRLGQEENMAMFWLFLAGLGGSSMVSVVARSLKVNSEKKFPHSNLELPAVRQFVVLLLQIVHEAFTAIPRRGAVGSTSSPDRDVDGEVRQLLVSSLPDGGQCLNLANSVHIPANEVAALAYCVSRCDAMKSVDLTNCGVNSTMLKQLLKHFTNVDTLSLRDNKSEMKGSACSTLQRAFTGKDGYTLRNMKSLCLYQCGLDQTDCKLLAAGFRLCFSLEVLQLNWNDVGDEVAVSLAKLLEADGNHKLRELVLTRCEIGSRGAIHLLKATAGNSRVQHLGLSQNPKIGDDAGAALGVLLAKQRSLPCTLLMNKVSIGDQGLKDAADAIKQEVGTCDLQQSEHVLKVSMTDSKSSPSAKEVLAAAMDGRSSGVINFGASRIERGCLVETDVKALLMESLKDGMADLRYNLEPAGVVRLRNVLEELPADQVHDLRLRNNKLDDNSVPILTEILVNSIGLHSMSLYDNSISSAGLARFCQMVVAEGIYRDLRFFNIGRNPVGGRHGMEGLANWLESEDCELQSLGLYYCGIDDDDAAILFEALKNNVSLKFLDLGWNNLTDRSLHLFGEMLAENTTLLYAQMQNCQGISDNGVRALSDVLHKNRYFRTLSLGQIKALSESVFSDRVKDGYHRCNDYGPID